MPWSKATFRNAAELNGTIELARISVKRAPVGVGVFRSREFLELYLSPVATDALRPAFAAALAVIECARPNELHVEVVVGPYGEPAWYDQAEKYLAREADVMGADELGLLGPDTEIDEIIEQYFVA